MALRKRSRDKKAVSTLNFNLRVPLINFTISGYPKLGEDFVTKSSKESMHASQKLKKYVFLLMEVKDRNELFDVPELSKILKKFRRDVKRVIYEKIEEKTGKNFTQSILPYVYKDLENNDE